MLNFKYLHYLCSDFVATCAVCKRLFRMSVHYFF